MFQTLWKVQKGKSTARDRIRIQHEWMGGLEMHDGGTGPLQRERGWRRWEDIDRRVLSVEEPVRRCGQDNGLTWGASLDAVVARSRTHAGPDCAGVRSNGAERRNRRERRNNRPGGVSALSSWSDRSGALRPRWGFRSAQHVRDAAMAWREGVGGRTGDQDVSRWREGLKMKIG
ncbi:hypothetical protein VTN00DRAFT_607 [Thermoascus crustaceus]|uniref:uncharacterized protein n=1 Tax=Thermoascus crustaceus TaxID=5088 RepID=UPI003742CA87